MFQPLPTNNYQANNYGQIPPTFSPGSFKANAVSYNQPQNQLTEAPEKPQTIQKPPIPEEHIHMQTVFDELKYQCSCAANNPVSFFFYKCRRIYYFAFIFSKQNVKSKTSEGN